MPGEQPPSEEELRAAQEFQAEADVEQEVEPIIEHREGQNVVERLRDNVWLLRHEGPRGLRNQEARNPVSVVFRRGAELFITDPGTSGLSGSKNRNLEWLESEQDADVKGVLLTHSHPDHIGNLQNVSDEADPIYLHPRAYWSLRSPKVLLRGERVLTRPDSHPSKFKQVGYELLGEKIYGKGLKGTKKRTEANPEGRYLPLPEEPLQFDGYTVETIHTPGHTRGEVSFWIPENRILVGGDLVPNTRLGRDNIPSLYMPECNVYDALESLEKMRDLKARLFIPAHGDPIRGEEEIRERFQGMIELLQTLVDRTRSAQTENPHWGEMDVARWVFNHPDIPEGLRGSLIFGDIEKKSIVHSVMRDEKK